MISSYLTVNAYAEFHRWLGRGEVLAPMWEAWAEGDRKRANEVIPDGSWTTRRPRLVRGSAASTIAPLRRGRRGDPDPRDRAVGVDLAEAVEGLAPR